MKKKNSGYVAAIQRYKGEFYSSILKTEDKGNTWKLMNRVKEMILNLEEIDGVLYGSGNDVVISNIDNKNKWEYIFCDSGGKVGQIRDLERNSNGDFLAVSFNGYIINLNNKKSNTQKITHNHLRSLTSLKNGMWIAVGDKNREEGNMFISDDGGKKWTSKEDKFPDIHRVKKFKDKLWIVGKNGLLMSLKN